MTTAYQVKEQKQESEQHFYVYLLQASSGRATYVGATTNLERRLRQHNKEIVGGATATGMRVLRGETWARVCHISGFPTWNAALQFEWRFKQITRRLPPGGSSVDRRKRALETLLALDRPTTKAIAYSEWPNGIGPIVTWS
jgi:structure-specific endonuclease subunit SLX1